MPGYILHMAAAKMALAHMKLAPKDENAFLIGCVLPDATRNKKLSHFRNPNRYGMRIEYPDMALFDAKYRPLMDSAVVMGYHFHLYVDFRFFTEYLPTIVEFRNEVGDVKELKKDVTHAKIKKTGEIVPDMVFFSKELYYGDYTRMNTWLAEEFQVAFDPSDFDFDIDNPGIDEIDVREAKKVFEELQDYLNVPIEEADHLQVFDKEALVLFLKGIANDWCLGENFLQ